MFVFARQLVRYADETGKPNADRLKEYSDSNLPTIKDGLEAPVPVYPTSKRSNSLRLHEMVHERRRG